MDGLEIRLLGRPTVLIAGRTAGPARGAKAWGLLAYLALTDRAHLRAELAEMLFSEAQDPLGALRWSLAELRRLLALPEALKGDGLSLELPEGALIDALAIEVGDPNAIDQPGFGQELLGGLSFADSPIFETWLLSARRRLARKSASALRAATLNCLARGEHDTAINYATRLVVIDSLDEGHHALLIRSHALAGDVVAARRHYDRCREILRRELACEPGAAVLAALAVAERDPTGARPEDLDAVGARLAVAWQSFLGGAVDHAVDLGRGAVWAADGTGDPAAGLLPRMFLAAMLGMAVRGWDEAAASLSQALRIAQRLDRPTEAATALGVLAGSHLMRADYDVARRLATDGLALSDDPGARSVNLMFLGAADADQARGAEAAGHSRAAVAAAQRAGDPVLIVYAATHAARVALLDGDPHAARAPIETALTHSSGMLALRPWPMTMLAEVEIAADHLDAAAGLAAQAAALAATTGIAYQRALAYRATALVEARRGRTRIAVERLTDALSHARRTTGEGYPLHWTIAFILDSLSSTTADFDGEASRRWAQALLDHASASDMHEFTARARRHLRSSTKR